MTSDLHRKIEAVHRMCTILSRRPVTDELVAGMVESLASATAEQVEIATAYSIRNEVTLPTPSQILERVESGYYSEVTVIPVKLDLAEKIKTWWNDDMNDCGITDPHQYDLHVKKWEIENPGLGYFDTVVKRGY